MKKTNKKGPIWSDTGPATYAVDDEEQPCLTLTVGAGIKPSAFLF